MQGEWLLCEVTGTAVEIRCLLGHSTISPEVCGKRGRQTRPISTCAGILSYPAAGSCGRLAETSQVFAASLALIFSTTSTNSLTSVSVWISPVESSVHVVCRFNEFVVSYYFAKKRPSTMTRRIVTLLQGTRIGQTLIARDVFKSAQKHTNWRWLLSLPDWPSMRGRYKTPTWFMGSHLNSTLGRWVRSPPPLPA